MSKPPPKPHEKKPRPAVLQPLTAHAGQVREYLPNPDQIYDKLVLATADGPALTIKFPPHFGQELLAAAQPGAEVALLAFAKPGPGGQAHLHLACLTVGERTLRPRPPVPPAPPTAADAVALTSEIAALRLHPDGRLHGLALADGTRLKFPPPVGKALAGRVQVGAAIEVSGFHRPVRPGEAAAGEGRSVQAEILTLGGESFLVR